MPKHPLIFSFLFTILLLISLPFPPVTLANLLSEPVQTGSQYCHLDLSSELFGGVKEACGHNLDKSRCCPVLAAWLFAAHARNALQLPTPSSTSSSNTYILGTDLPMIPDDSENCVNALESALESKNVRIPQPNATCDTVLCFCGIRLHQIASLSCPAAFNVSSGFRNATPTAAVEDLEKSCRNSSYPGCNKCLGALQKLKATKTTSKNSTATYKDDRASRIFNRDCQLMGLTWLLGRNKTAYIPTVSAVLRAIMYNSHPPSDSKCSPDQENMPLAVDSLQFEMPQSAASVSTFTWSALGFPVFPILILLFLVGQVGCIRGQFIEDE